MWDPRATCDTTLPLSAPSEMDASALDARYAAYARVDEYGPMACFIPRHYKLQLLLVWLTLLPLLRALVCVVCIVVFFLCCRLSDLFSAQWAHVLLPHAASACCRTVLFCCGVWRLRVNRDAGSTAVEAKTAVYVANHVSWLDILVLMEQHFPAFISKASVKQLPLVGVIASSMQCIFAEREKTNGGDGQNGAGAQVKAHVARRVADSRTCRPLVAFPEGTTTNGMFLLPFKTGAFLAGVPVQPVLLQYSRSPFSPAFETIHVVRSVVLMLSQPWVSVEVTYLQTAVPTEQERCDPSTFASRVREQMLAAGAARWGLQPSSLTLTDKRAYHSALLQLHDAWKRSQKSKGHKSE